jgi:hypothetical protein
MSPPVRRCSRKSSALDVVAAQHLPAAFGMHERCALGGESPQLRFVEPELADPKPPVEVCEETG